MDGLRGTLERGRVSKLQHLVMPHLIVEPDRALGPLVVFCFLLLLLKLLHVVVKLVVDRIVPVDIVETADG